MIKHKTILIIYLLFGHLEKFMSTALPSHILLWYLSILHKKLKQKFLVFNKSKLMAYWDSHHAHAGGSHQ